MEEEEFGEQTGLDPNVFGVLSLVCGVAGALIGFLGLIVCPIVGLLALPLGIGGIFTGYKAITAEEGLSAPPGVMGLIGAIMSVLALLAGLLVILVFGLVMLYAFFVGGVMSILSL